MTVNEFAMNLLRECGCDEYTYGGRDSENLMNDLKTQFPNGTDFPLVDIANAILAVSRPRPIVRKPYRVTWENEHSCDGFDCDSFERAKGEAFDTLLEWMSDESLKWDFDDNMTPIPTPEQIDDWNYMIYNCGVYLYKYNPDTDEYDEIEDWATEAEFEEIGWKELRDLNEKE